TRRAAEREVLQRKPERLGIREPSFEEVEARLERRKLLVVELELRQEVPLGAKRVQLFAGELVALRVEWHPERDELCAVRVETAGERLVAHLLVALDVRLDVARGERPALRHQEGDERELPDQLVGVMAHLWASLSNLRRRFAALEMLVARAVVAVRERRALAGLALPRRRTAARDPAVEGTCLDLLLDEAHRGFDSLGHGPRHLGLHRDRE